MAGRRVYLTASTAKDHIIKIWEKEGGLLLKEEGQIPHLIKASLVLIAEKKVK